MEAPLQFDIPRPFDFLFQYPMVPIAVVDGDTIDCLIDRGFGDTQAFRCRLADLDAPEMRGENASPAGREAMYFVVRWFEEREGAPLVLYTAKGHKSTKGIGDGSFGRWLGNVLDEGADSLAEALIRAGHAERGFMP